MRLTRRITWKAKEGLHQVSITLSPSDLAPEYADPKFAPYLSTLLDIAADRHITSTLNRAGRLSDSKVQEKAAVLDQVEQAIKFVVDA